MENGLWYDCTRILVYCRTGTCSNDVVRYNLLLYSDGLNFS